MKVTVIQQLCFVYCMTCSPVNIDEVEECTDDDDIDDLDEDGEPIISEDDNSDDDDDVRPLYLSKLTTYLFALQAHK